MKSLHPSRYIIGIIQLVLIPICIPPSVFAGRLAFQYASDPFYVGVDYPRLSAPQWVDEPGIEAVVILSVDDMRSPQAYREFLAPIVDRLKQAYGSAPLSIFCNALDPTDPEYEAFLRDGMSLEVHTLSHPCPLLQKGDFDSAVDNVLGSLNLLSRIPGNRPVAFRMPCCDSMNSASPRFFNEILPMKDDSGNRLSIDSSIMNIATSSDLELERSWVLDENNQERFLKYIPFPKFKTVVENYPWPYRSGDVWEFPAAVPSDWEAQNSQGSNHPGTVEDWKRQLDITVKKQGVMTLILHPHGWIQASQIVEFIDYAIDVYGSKIKFLNFAEVLMELERNLLGLHGSDVLKGRSEGFRLLDVNGDGYQDVLLFDPTRAVARIWNKDLRSWSEVPCPSGLNEDCHFGQFSPQTGLYALKNTDGNAQAWVYQTGGWVSDSALFEGLEAEGIPIQTGRSEQDNGFRMIDLDSDGVTEALILNSRLQAVFQWDPQKGRWQEEAVHIPEGMWVVDDQGKDNGLRFVDLNGDGMLDLLQSNQAAYSVFAFLDEPILNWDFPRGWSVPVRQGLAGDARRIPPIVRSGEHPSNGAWFKDGYLWVQNEDTASLDGLVQSMSYREILSFDAPDPLEPNQAIGSFQTLPGFKIELVASEPAVRDPVAFDWDEGGRLWVVEMGDYPSGIDGKGKAGGKIRVLKDPDKDGFYEDSTVFLDGLNFPTGLHHWKNGVYISAAPDILYAADLDGDLRADRVETVFNGFKEGNQQHRVNGFQWSLEGWLVGANGDSGGIINGGGLNEPINLRGWDFRFHPDSRMFETIPGQSQFGRNRDDWGNWFGNNNPNWLWHYDVPVHYFTDDPFVLIDSNKNMLAQHEPGVKVFPTSRPMRRFNWPNLINTLTSACSPSPYRDELFGEGFETSVFISEPAHNLVHREILSRDGISFTSLHGVTVDQREFLTSTDVWFRPTTVKTGPDGALYVADMYRLVIEHPEYALDGIGEYIDLRAGEDRGRIYKVYPDGLRLPEIHDFRHDTVEQIADALGSSNGWQRDTAHRLLVEKNAVSSVITLEKVMKSGPQPKARLQAMAVLNTLSALKPESIPFNDPNESVRKWAIRFAEPFLADNPYALSKLMDLMFDPDPQVVQQAVLSCRFAQGRDSSRALARVYLESSGREALQQAVLSTAGRDPEPFLFELVQAVDGDTWSPELCGLAAAFGMTMGKEATIRAALVLLNRLPVSIHDPGALQTLLHCVDAMQKRRVAWPVEIQSAQGGLLDHWQDLQKQFEHINKLLTGRNRYPFGADVLNPLIGLVGAGPHNKEPGAELFLEYLHSSLPMEGVEISWRRLKGLSDSESVLDGLVGIWQQIRPELVPQIMDWIARDRSRALLFLSYVESQKLNARALSASMARVLTQHKDADVNRKAGSLFGRPASDRTAVLKEFASVVDLTGDPSKGAGHFEKLCMQCHSFRGGDTRVGPDLTTVSGQDVATLLRSILDPSYAVEETFVPYMIRLSDDEVIQGVLRSETPSSLVIRTASGVDELIRREDIQSIETSPGSLMPDGFEVGLAPGDLADLIAFIRNKGTSDQ